MGHILLPYSARDLFAPSPAFQVHGYRLSLSQIGIHSQVRLLPWGVLIYKSVSDLNVTIGQPRHLNFRGRTIFIRSNFFVVCFARHKNFLLFLSILNENKEENKENKGNSFGVCKKNNKEI